MSADPSELISRTEDLFVARSLEDDARAEAVSIRFIDIYRFLTEAGFTLPHAQQAVLFSNERIRRDFQQLSKDFAARLHRTVVPVAAAASDGTLTERRFPGGVIRLAASAVDSQHMYVMFEFEGQAPSFRAIELEEPAGTLRRWPWIRRTKMDCSRSCLIFAVRITPPSSGCCKTPTPKAHFRDGVPALRRQGGDWYHSRTDRNPQVRAGTIPLLNVQPCASALVWNAQR